MYDHLSGRVVEITSIDDVYSTIAFKVYKMVGASSYKIQADLHQIERLQKDINYMITLVVSNGFYISHFRFEKKVIADDSLPPNARLTFPSNGYDLGEWRRPYQLFDEEYGIGYWGGLAKEANQQICPRLFLYALRDGLLIDALGYRVRQKRRNTQRYARGLRIQKTSLQQGEWRNLVPHISTFREDLLSAKDITVQSPPLIRFISSAHISDFYLKSWKRKLGDTTSLWDAAWLLAHEQKGAEHEDKMRIAMLAGDIIWYVDE